MVVRLGSVASVLALLIGLVWFGWHRRQWMPVAGINAAVALGAVLLMARHLHAALTYRETSTLVPFAFEVSVLVAAALAVFGLRVPGWLIATQAAVNFLLAFALAVFLYAFKLNRLF